MPEAGRLRELIRARRGELAGLAGIAAVAVALFWPLLAQGRVLFGRDIGVVIQPQAEAFFRAVREGAWPLWNPAVGFGQPMLADPTALILYPTTWGVLLLAPWTWHTFHVVSHFVFTGAGMYLLARSLGRSTLASAFAGAAWLLSGPLVSLVPVHHLAAAAWVPWVVLATRRVAERRRWSDVGWWAIAVGVQGLAGSADMTLVSLALSAAAIGPEAVQALRSRPPGAAIARALAAAAVAGGVTAAIVSGLALPALDLLRQRMQITAEARAFWSIHPISVVQLVFPVFFRDLPRYSERVAGLFELWEPFLASIYLGLPALALVLAGLFGPRTPWKGRLAAVFVVSLMLALGSHTPLHALAARVFPPLGVLRYPAKMMLPAAWAWALLASAGVDAWRAAPRRSWWGGVIAPVGLLAAVGATAAFVLWRRPDSVGKLILSPTAAVPAAIVFAPPMHALALGALLTVIVLGLAAWPKQARLAGGIAAAIATLDLLAVNRTVNPTVKSDFYRYRPPILAAIPTAPRSRIYAWDYTPASAQPPRHPLLVEFLYFKPGTPLEVGGALGMQEYLYPPSGSRWGIFGSFDRDLVGMTPAAVSDLRRLLLAVEDTPAFVRVLELGAVDHVVALHAEGQSLPQVATIDSVLRRPILVFRVPHPLPRLYTVAEARFALGDDALRTLVAPDFDPRRTVVLPPEARSEAQGTGEGEAGISVTEERSDRLRAVVDAHDRVWLVRVGANAPGWRAAVDGVPVRLWTANHAFQAVSVPAGRHTVEIAYRPRAVTAGVVLSAFGLAIAVALVVRGRATAL